MALLPCCPAAAASALFLGLGAPFPQLPHSLFKHLRLHLRLQELLPTVVAQILQAAELRALAIFRVDPASGLITGSDAVVRVVSGAPDDECLPTLMPVP